jgi:proteasome regulatory subunit
MNLEEKARNFRQYLASTEGATGAEIKAIVSEAGMFAIRRNSGQVTVSDIKKAITKVIKGSKKSHDRFEFYA